MKKRYVVYGFLAGLLLASAICVRIMKDTILYVDCAKVTEQRDESVIIMFYHSNTDRYYMVRVPTGNLQNDFAEVTATIWDPGRHQVSTDALFGESALDLAKDMAFSKPAWGLREDQLVRREVGRE